jgi:DNA polymerase III subunit delta
MSLTTPDELETELRRKQVRPVYLLLGPEEYLRNRALKLLKEATLTSEAVVFNYAEFAATSGSLGESLDILNTFPMMAPRRMVVVSEIDALDKPEQERLGAYVRRPSDRSVLVLVAENLDQRTTFYATLKEKTCVVEFPKLKGFALERWAQDLIRTRGYRISSESIRKLVDLAGSDLQSLANETEKLLIYCSDQKTIPDSAVDDSIGASRHHSIFELTDALGRRDRKKALRLLGNLLASGENAQYITAMLARHFRQILIAKELLNQGRNSREIGTAAQIHPYALDGFIRQARAIDERVAERMYVGLASADFRLKSSGVEKRLIFEHLICAL